MVRRCTRLFVIYSQHFSPSAACLSTALSSLAVQMHSQSKEKRNYADKLRLAIRSSVAQVEFIMPV